MGATRLRGLSKTITGWSILTGLAALLTGHRRLARAAFHTAGAGGVGAAYGWWARHRDVRVEPVAVLRTRPWEDREWRNSVLFHGVFWVWAEWLGRKT